MDSIALVCCACLSAVCMFARETHSLPKLQPLRREVRFTKFDLQLANESIGKILECSFKQYPDKQRITVHTIVHKKITNFNVMFSVSKCKEYYVDCVNSVSYDISDMCTKLSFVVSFVNTENSKQLWINKCPIHGEYYYKNLTFESDHFGSVGGLPNEKWWELYWKMSYTFYNAQEPYGSLDMEFYFLQFRSRNRKH